MENQSMAQPKPMMTFPDAVKTCLRKYGDFSGRATRAEYWWWVLAVVIGSSIFTAVDSSIASFSGQGYTPFATIFSLAMPSIRSTTNPARPQASWSASKYSPPGQPGVIPWCRSRSSRMSQAQIPGTALQ